MLLDAFQAVWRNPYVRVIVALLFLWTLYLTFREVLTILSLGIVAYLIAYLTHPLLVWLERKKVRRPLGVALVVLLIIALFALALTLLIAILTQFSLLITKLPTLATSLVAWFNSTLEGFGNVGWAQTVRNQLSSSTTGLADALSKSVLPQLERILSPGGPLIGGVFKLAGGVAETVATLILSVFIMLDYPKIGRTLLDAFPLPWQPRVLEFSTLIEKAVGGYFRGQVIIAIIVGTLVAIGFSLIGLPSALALGFLAGALNLVPYLGIIIALVPALLLAASLGWVQVVAVIVISILANQLEGHVFSPLILGRATNLHPVTVALAILTGLHLMGILGALLAVPLAGLGKLMIATYYHPSRVYKEGV